MGQGPGGREAGDCLLARVATKALAVRRDQRVIGGQGAAVEGAWVEAAGGPVGGENADRVGAQGAAEIGPALGHGAADQGLDLDAPGQHLLAELDPVGDMRGQDDDIRPVGGEESEDFVPVGVPGDVGDRPGDRETELVSRAERGRGHRVAVGVIDLHHADAEPAGRLAQARCQLLGGEYGRSVAEVASRGADSEDIRQRLAGELVGDGAGLPVDQAGAGGGVGGGNRE